MISEHDIEEWKPVQLEGYEKYYEISSFGRIRSLRQNRLLRPFKASRMQYWAIALHGDGVSIKKYIHQLVLLTFVGPCPEGMESCHGELGKDVNRVDNLRWDTRLSNSHDLDIHGTRQLGETHHQRKLTEADVLLIRRTKRKHGYIGEFAKRFGVCRGTIADVIKRKTWSHLPE